MYTSLHELMCRGPERGIETRTYG